MSFSTPYPPTDDDLLTDELLAIDAAHVLPKVNADLTAGAITAMAAAERIACHRAALVAQLGESPVRCIDRLPAVARAAFLVDATFRALPGGTEPRAIGLELAAERDALRKEVESLIARGALHPKTLASQSQRFSHPNLCQDVLQLTAVLDEHLSGPEPAAFVTRADLARAEALVNALALATVEREQKRPSPLADLRARAFTLLVSTYDDVRRLITFLRWKEGDADAIAPSLWATTGAVGGRRRGRGAGAPIEVAERGSRRPRVHAAR